VYDKTVRRRRAVLGLLVAGSLILLTAYFGESAGGGLHSVQRGVVEVVSPIQEGASRALKPVRDLVGWVGDTIDAKGEVKQLRAERDQLRERAITGAAAARENDQLRDLLSLDKARGLEDEQPVAARVIGQDPNLWWSQVLINKGSNDGVLPNHPVVGPEGLVGVVSTATPSSAVVTLLTDHTVAVGARSRRASRSSRPARSRARTASPRCTRRASRSAASRAWRTRRPTTNSSTCVRSPTCGASTSSRS
jgi:rod shape-determining protein MreC